MIPANYEVLVAMSTDLHETPSVRAYLVELLGEHREMRRALLDAVQIEHDSLHMSEEHIFDCRKEWLPRAEAAITAAGGKVPKP